MCGLKRCGRRERVGGRGGGWRCGKGLGSEGFLGLLHREGGFGSEVERTGRGLRWLRRRQCIHPLRGVCEEEGHERHKSHLP